jgi:hypothetical protein
MKSEKLIIQNDSDLKMEDVLGIAQYVVKMGRISGKQYCYLTSLKVDGTEYHVVSDLNKKSDKLTVYKAKTT